LSHKIFLSDYRWFPDIYVSQGSVATRIRCGGFFNIVHYTFTAESDGERILKIGQHGNMAKLWARVGCPVFSRLTRSNGNGGTSMY